MTFDDWWADYDPDLDYDEIAARDTWRAACTAAAALVLEIAAGRDAEAIAEAILELREID